MALARMPTLARMLIQSPALVITTMAKTMAAHGECDNDCDEEDYVNDNEYGEDELYEDDV